MKLICVYFFIIFLSICSSHSPTVTFALVQCKNKISECVALWKEWKFVDS